MVKTKCKTKKVLVLLLMLQLMTMIRKQYGLKKRLDVKMEDKKIGFRDLTTAMKTFVVLGWCVIFIYALAFVAGVLSIFQ